MGLVSLPLLSFLSLCGLSSQQNSEPNNRLYVVCLPASGILLYQHQMDKYTVVSF